MTDKATLNLIGELAENIKENDLAEISYETEDVKIRVVGKTQPQTSTTTVQVNESESENQQISTVNPQPEEKFIVSPIVGVVYLRPAPDKSPYVKIGEEVTPDTDVCLIEAMKTFNPIKANMNGKIRSVLVKDGDPVEYGKPLFSII